MVRVRMIDLAGGMEGNRGVSISGGRAMVAALQEDDAGGLQSGKAYIFNAPDAAP